MFFFFFFHRKQNALELAAKANAADISPGGGPAGRGEGRGRGDYLIKFISSRK